jgi:hypothetical protein
MQAGTVDRAKTLLEHMIACMMQRSCCLLQCWLDDHDGTVRGKERQKLRHNRSTLRGGIDRRRKQFIETIRQNNEVIWPMTHNLFTKVAFEWMFQVALDTPETFAGYSYLPTIGLPQFPRVA